MKFRQGSNADIVHRQNGGFPSREGGFDSQPSLPDVCYRIAAPWKGKTATRGLPVRCMKAAGRIIIIWLAPAMNEETDATDIPAQG